LTVLVLQILTAARGSIDLGEDKSAGGFGGSVIRLPLKLEWVDLTLVSQVSATAAFGVRYNGLVPEG
jgi:hypothetical protein